MMLPACVKRKEGRVMIFFNLPIDIIYQRFFRKPEVLRAYLWIYEVSIRPVASQYKQYGFKDGVRPISASYAAAGLQTTESQAASWLRTLERAGYIIKKKVEGLKEAVYEVLAITDKQEGLFRTVYFPGNKSINELWKQGKHVLAVYIYMAIEANITKGYSGQLNRELEENHAGVTYKDICYYCNCTINQARRVLSWLENIAAIVKEGFRGIGMKILMKLLPKKKEKVKEEKTVVRTETVSRKDTVSEKVVQHLTNHSSSPPPSSSFPLPSTQDPPSDLIEDGVRYYLYQKKGVKKIPCNEFVDKLRELFRGQGYDSGRLRQCIDDLSNIPAFIRDYPQPAVMCDYIDNWYKAKVMGMKVEDYINSKNNRSYGKPTGQGYDRRGAAPISLDAPPEAYEKPKKVLR